MSIFKKDKKTSEKPPAGRDLYKKDEISEFLDGKSLKKKTKVGFRLERNEPPQPEKKVVRPYDEAKKEIEDTLEDLYPDDKEKIASHDEYEEKDDESKKKKSLLKKDMKGKPVYLEDTGEKLGTVFDAIYDKENSLVGYKIKDSKSDAVLSFSIDQFDEDKSGLIFVPSWYMQAVKNIEKFEFKDRISPELTSLLTDDAISNKELYKIFVKYDDEMAKYIEDAISIKEMLNNRLKVLEKQRLALKDNLMDLTEKRLIKDIDRREFSEDVMEHRRKVNILDVNINKCKELLKRLDHTSFGILGKATMLSDINIGEGIYEKIHEKLEEKNNIVFDERLEGPYKQKYYTLKDQFEQLEDEYQELKMAVERLLSKKEL
jgi:hypothetical protein